MAFIGTTQSSGSSLSGKLQIDSAGLTIVDTNAGTYNITSGGHIQLGTSASNCLQIFHDVNSNNSFISEIGTGDMCIVTNGSNLYLQKDATPGAAEDMIHCIANGAVKLFYDGGSNTTAKLETTATGVKVNGNLEVTGTGGGGLPTGAIVMWSGATNAIPSGYVICDGNNNTPDLRNKFIIGAGSSYAVDATGGSADAVVVQHNHGASSSSSSSSSSSVTDPGHAHTWTRQDAQNDVGYRPWPASNNDCKATTVNTGSNTTGISVSTSTSTSTSTSINNEGVSGTNKNLPPYYALAYIMKT